MQANDFINNLIEKPENMEESQRKILFGGLTEDYKYADDYVYKTLPEGHRSAYKIGEYQEIFDPGSDCSHPLIFIYKFYGEKYLMRLRNELKDCKCPSSHQVKTSISPELIMNMKKIYEKKRPPDKQNSVRSKKVESDVSQNAQQKAISKESSFSVSNPYDEKYFYKTYRKLPRNEKYRKVFKGPGTVWDWLWGNIIRKGWNDTEGYPLKEEYFDNHFLVYSSTYPEIAKKCGMSKNTVAKYIKKFEEEGVIRIKYLKPKGKKRGQSVFILGEWRIVDGEYQEILYRDTAFD